MLKTNRKIARRNVVTVDDRRAVMLLAKARTPKEIAVVKHEDFIRRALKQRLGWPQTEPASEPLKLAAKEIANVLATQAKEAAAKAKAEADAKAKVEADAKAKKAADEQRWTEMSLKEHLTEMGADAATVAEVRN